ncbi:RhoGAP-domain-containing protein [Laetiporus sulphureus 93-53]|uniref:RhoGAP-domain-containing protein n=1 Tax=Laetiporus sulphureus 93-53 TaxID=1314785 RepID=A0A165GSF4_9APHY|nr:RhoGAP-domain-containing protein [Laetiporus sulphureus 93-53]KZT10745.1 RhoGAP-domain-containing protein [Laetiporus sulphureus 93-53]
MLAALSPSPPSMSSAAPLDAFGDELATGSALLTENRICPGCNKSVVDENGGMVVVAFGQSFFHVDCFKCAKCGNQVTADTNLLLLSDGSPICANCSYCCNVCKQPILDEAIMTGDDSYHAHCFKCKVCKNRIDELVFAKTSQGIYCMDCHNQRVARSRRHAQRQREKEKEREREREKAAVALMGPAAVGSGSGGINRSTEDALRAQDSIKQNNSPSSAQTQSSGQQSATGPSSTSPGQISSARTSADGSSANGQPDHRSSTSSTPAKQTTSPVPFITTTLTSPAPLSINKRPSTAPSADAPSASTDASRIASSRLGSLAVPNGSDTAEKALHTRKSFDGGVRSLAPQIRPSPSAYSLNATGDSNGLNVTHGETSRKDKRKSINPSVTQTFSSTAQDLSSFLSLTSPVRDSPHSVSPLRDHFSAGKTASPQGMYPSRPSGPSSPRGSLDDGASPTGRARAGSSNAYIFKLPRMHEQIPSRPGSAMGLPSRPNSRADHHHRLGPYSSASESAHDTPYHDAGRRGPEGKRPPSLNLLAGNNARAQKALDDRSRASPTPSLRATRDHRSSSGTAELDLPPRPNSVPTPTSPSHHVDVPHSIESGTDTENESEEMRTTKRQDAPPALPPKEAFSVRNGRSSYEDGATESSESSPVERTSHATFIAPALPPIRISMGGTDFSELLRSVGGSITKLEQLAETTEGGGRKLDLAMTTQVAATSTNTETAQPSTPRSDVTVMESAEMQSNGAALRRMEASLPQGLVRGIGGTMASSISNISSLNSEVLSKFPDVPSSLKPGVEDEAKAYLKASKDDENARGLAANIMITSADDTAPESSSAEAFAIVIRQLQDSLSAASERGATQVSLGVDLAQNLLRLLTQQKEEYEELKRKLDGIRRTSQNYMDGLTVAQAEYDRELKARRDAEAEVTRLRVLLSGQTVRLSVISGESKRQEAQKQLSQELSNNLSSLGRSVSILKVERDMTLAEMEQLSASKRSSTPVGGEEGVASLTRALSTRFDNIKNQYQNELVPLTEQREALMREVTELKASRDAFLEETTALNARNEELAQLNAQYIRRLETAGLDPTIVKHGQDIDARDKFDNADDRARHEQSPSLSATSSTVALTEESESRFIKVSRPEAVEAPGAFRPPKFIKWPGHKAPKEAVAISWPEAAKPPTRKEHVFQQISVLRVARCDHCGDKMWGSQSRCLNCNIAVHTRCLHHVHLPCSQQTMHSREDSSTPGLAHFPPSMFGRDLTEQVRYESRDEPRLIPIIVEKCIEAVEALAMDLEGIYRKTGGSGQSKMITQLFERGDYHGFDLRDTDRFNDICSVTSVLKSYFRALPDPLFTIALHSNFMSAAAIRDPAARTKAFTEIVAELPKEHYYTARALILHLHRVSKRSDQNLMHAQNLGVVFGPTLMRSQDSLADLGTMGGSATSVQWLVENAHTIFEQPPSFDQ